MVFRRETLYILYSIINVHIPHSYFSYYKAGEMVHWLKLPAWKVGDRGFEPHSGLHVSK